MSNHAVAQLNKTNIAGSRKTAGELCKSGRTSPVTSSIGCWKNEREL
jgi:hypothetical protein